MPAASRSSTGRRPTMVDHRYQRVLAGETTLEELIRAVPFEQIESGRDRLAAEAGRLPAGGAAGRVREVA